MLEGPRILLCADDYAQASGISEGIFRLAEVGRLSATSAMTNVPGWGGADGARLAALEGRIAVGLHLTLTYGAPLRKCLSLRRGGGFRLLGAS